MNTRKIVAPVFGLLVMSASAFAQSISYGITTSSDSVGHVTACTSNGRVCPPPIYGSQVIGSDGGYYNTETQVLTMNGPAGGQVKLQFVNNIANPASLCVTLEQGAARVTQEPLSYCENNENTYLLSTLSAVYDPKTAAITMNIYQLSNWVEYGVAVPQWLKYEIAGVVLTPTNAL